MDSAEPGVAPIAVTYPDDLPIVERRDELLAAIDEFGLEQVMQARPAARLREFSGWLNGLARTSCMSSRRSGLRRCWQALPQRRASSPLS